jgi:hypothetical protein
VVLFHVGGVVADMAYLVMALVWEARWNGMVRQAAFTVGLRPG